MANTFPRLFFFFFFFLGGGVPSTSAQLSMYENLKDNV